MTPPRVKMQGGGVPAGKRAHNDNIPKLRPVEVVSKAGSRSGAMSGAGTPRSRSGMSGAETDLESDCSESVSVIDIASEATWCEDTSDEEWEEDRRAGVDGDDSSDERHGGHPMLRYRECQQVNILFKKERKDAPKRKSKS